jgi:hypothetical protein
MLAWSVAQDRTLLIWSAWCTSRWPTSMRWAPGRQFPVSMIAEGRGRHWVGRRSWRSTDNDPADGDGPAGVIGEIHHEHRNRSTRRSVEIPETGRPRVELARPSTAGITSPPPGPRKGRRAGHPRLASAEAMVRMLPARSGVSGAAAWPPNSRSPSHLVRGSSTEQTPRRPATWSMPHTLDAAARRSEPRAIDLLIADRWQVHQQLSEQALRVEALFSTQPSDP